MASQAAFLRGMNVGGHRLTNAELVAVLDELGFADARAVLASGNLVFDAGRRRGAKLEQELAAGLEASLGYAVPVFLRSPEELDGLAEAFPFAPSELERAGKPQLVLLRRSVTAKQRREVEAARDDGDRFEEADRCLWWLPAGGVSESETDWSRLERVLGTTTTRTWNTIEKVRAKLR